MTEQLAFAGRAFRIKPTTPAPVADVAETATVAAHKAVTAAEGDLLALYGRPACKEHWSRVATAYERRAIAWRQLAEEIRPDGHGHSSRAMALAADADMARARMLRERLGVTG